MEEKTLDYSGMNETQNDFATTDFDHSSLDKPGLAADMELIKGLADEKDLAMLSRDSGGFQLGNSRTMVRHIQEAAKRIRSMIDTQTGDRGLYKDTGLTEQQRRELQGEAKAILSRAFMDARAEFIRRSGKPLDGY